MRPAFAVLLLLALPACSSPPAHRTTGTVERLDPRFEALVPPGAALEILADGFEWTEGPAWRKDGDYLLFTDIPKNTIYRWRDDEGLRVFLRPAGYSGSEPPGAELGANGLAFDARGRLVFCDHGNRALMRLDEANFTKTVLVDRYDGRRLNSPNDLAFRSGGDLYFTDPPYGLAGQDDDPHKELPFNGVYRLTPSGETTLLVDDLTRPNGLAFSPDERTLYVSNSDPEAARWMVYDVAPDGRLARGRVFFDATDRVQAGLKGLPDGMAIDRAGHLFATGPGGVLVFAPDGTHLGTLVTGEATANVTFGDDGASLYVTADRYLLRVRLTTTGAGFPAR